MTATGGCLSINLGIDARRRLVLADAEQCL